MTKRFYKKLEREKVSPQENFLALHSPDFNEETKAAMREARLISEGKIPSKSFNSVDDLIKDLMSDADD